ncbi:MAG TPA: prolyl oligopeptidase family serine peptidase [Herpetosiphonaceae bacterium]|nr:prolyl oligopeptidase family serine peptidase [Herpetosiphonaceae bacterium]
MALWSSVGSGPVVVFRLIAVKAGCGRHIWEDVPFTLVVDALEQELERRGVPVEYVLFPDEGHGFTKTANRIRSEVAIVRWFARHLAGRGVDAPPAAG